MREQIELLKRKMREKYPWISTDWECTKSPEGNWHSCCVKHDWDYAEGRNKWAADWDLFMCILRRWHPGVATVYYIMVTLFGWGPYWEHEEARNGAMREGK